MKFFKTYHQFLIRLLSILIVVSIGVYCFYKENYYTSFSIIVVGLLLLLELYMFSKRVFLVYERTILAMLQDDFSADFSHHKSYSSYKNLFRLYHKLKGKRGEYISKDLVYTSILNNIDTSVLILKKEKTDWEVLLLNDCFSSHFTIPKVSKWKYLQRLMPALCKVIEDNDFKEFKTSLQIRIRQQDTQTYILQTSKTIAYGQEYYIILLDSIQKVVEKKEKEAWINLMKVISHELLNSLTPIRSLSQNLYEIVQQPTMSEEDLDDIKQSAYTMLNRSNHLQQFVESYRKLAMLPPPKKQEISLQKLLNNCLLVMAPLFEKEKITLSNKIRFDRKIFVDIVQMEQVIINLLTNSLYALSKIDDKQIVIDGFIKRNRLFITITDNGKGIEKEIEDKVFLPFFTTRQAGAGIGLTLSKSIIEAHNGYLIFESDVGNTVFTISFLL